VRGHFPRGPAANKEYSFILLHTSADQRSGGVSGALRGGQGRETGRGLVLSTRHSSLATRHLSLVTVFASGCWFARARGEEPHRNPWLAQTLCLWESASFPE
jgi:hypothetical protein